LPIYNKETINVDICDLVQLRMMNIRNVIAKSR